MRSSAFTKLIKGVIFCSLVLVFASYPVWGEFRFHYNRAIRPDLFVDHIYEPEGKKDVMGISDESDATRSELPNSQSPQIAGAKIEIPSIGLVGKIYSGTNESELDKGAWLKPSSSTFGNPGNKVITGHKFTWRSGEGIFYNLPKVRVGDRVVIYIGGAQYIYGVERAFQVSSEEIWIEKDSGADTLTLYTCTSLDSSRRFVLIAEPL